jgi:hypothetical protein
MLLDADVGEAGDIARARETSHDFGRFVRSMVGLDRTANPPDGQITKILSSPLRKNILLFRNAKSAIYRFRPAPKQGRIAIVTDAGWDAMDAGCVRRDR